MNDKMNSMPRQYEHRDDDRYGQYDHGGMYGHEDREHGNDKLEDLKWLKNNMRGNIEEAKGFAMKANDMREKNPAIADLCKVMMRGHLQFEEEGDDVMRKLVEDYKRDAAHDPTAPGYASALEDERKDLRTEAQKVRTLVEPGK